MQYSRNLEWNNPLTELYFLKWLEAQKEKLKEKLCMTKENINIMIWEVKKTIEHINYNIEHQSNNQKIIVKNNDLKRNEIFYVWNIIWFILLASLDLKIYTEFLVYAKKDYDKVALMKNIAILLFETIDDIPQIISKKYFDSCNILSIDNNTLIWLNKIIESISDYKERYWDSLREIRNNIWAHRWHEFLKQIDCWDSINFIKFLPIVLEYDNIINELGNNLEKIMKESISNFWSV